MLWKAADWLMSQSDMDGSVNMYEEMYDEQRRRLIGIKMFCKEVSYGL